MVPPEALLAALALALSIWLGGEIVQGAKWIGHEGHKVGAKIVHVLKKIPH